MIEPSYPTVTNEFDRMSTLLSRSHLFLYSKIFFIIFFSDPSSTNGDDSETNHYVLKTPVMSIHKLKLPENTDPLQFILTIIKEYNSKKTKKEKKENDTSKPKTYKYLPCAKVRAINQESIKEKFDIKIFIQLSSYVSNFSKCYIDEEQVYTEEYEDIEIEKIERMPEETTINSIIFYYRDKSVYAVTKENSWHVVQRYTDYDFPIQMAELLLSEEGSKCIQLKHVIGENVTSQAVKHNQSPIPSDPLDPVVCTNFTSTLKKNSSLRKMDIFDDDVNNCINVTVGLGHIRIEKEFTTDEWVRIIDHLDFIYYDRDGEYERSKAFRQCLRKVDAEMSELLYKELHKILYNGFESIDDSGCNFQISHKYSRDFHLSTEYNLIYGNKVIKFDISPKIKDIFEALRDEPSVNSYMDTEKKSKEKILSRMDKFIKVLAKTQIEFLKGKRGEHSEKLVNFIEGSVFLKAVRTGE